MHNAVISSQAYRNAMQTNPNTSSEYKIVTIKHKAETPT